MSKIPYLEITDFESDGRLKKNVGNGKPVVIMVQSSRCGYCVKAKPAYEKLKNVTNSVFLTYILTDGGEKDRKAGLLMSKLDPNFRGVPAYFGFDSSGKFKKVHNGERDTESLKVFAHSL